METTSLTKFSHNWASHIQRTKIKGPQRKFSGWSQYQHTVSEMGRGKKEHFIFIPNVVISDLFLFKKENEEK